jgi:hypothetical protein
MGGIDRGSRQPPGQTPASQKKIGQRPFSQPVEQNSADNHENDEYDQPKPI